MTAILSAVAWSLALANIWGYGRSVRLGGLLGLACASSFIVLAWLSRDPFMAAANLGFLALHCWNLWTSHRATASPPNG